MASITQPSWEQHGPGLLGGARCSTVPLALLEDPCISSGPEARLLPGLSADSLALGGMSPPRGTCMFGLFANMKKR